MRLKYPWRAGFEVEVVLGTLGLSRFEEYEDDPMDTASASYCEAVARQLSEITGFRWSAPRKKPKQPGYYVLPEHDLDPINWHRGLVAGVELLTPPLPLEEADDVRQTLVDAIDDMVGWGIHDVRGPISDNCGWHINIDGGPDCRLDPSKYIVAVDEVPILARSRRLGNSCAAPQRHAFGIPLLRHLKVDPNAAHIRGYVDNLLSDCAGFSKRYAANFEKLANGYLELRHFGVYEFFAGPPLEELIGPMLYALELDATQEGRCEAPFVERYQILRRWLDGVRTDLYEELHPRGLVAVTGEVNFGRARIARIMLAGTADIVLEGARKYSGLSEVRHVHLPDLEEAIAIAAYDAAELMNHGLLKLRSRSRRFQGLIEQLAAELKAAPPIEPGEPIWTPWDGFTGHLPSGTGADEPAHDVGANEGVISTRST